MPTVEQRYTAATAYVRRAVATVEDRGVGYAVDPITGIVEWYAGKTKTEPARNELTHIEARWLRATHDIDRARVARDAELLADHVQESLPGAPQDRQRTNLYKGEVPTGTPATSYYEEAASQAGEYWDWATSKAQSLADDVKSVGTWLLLGGGVVLGWKVVDLLRERQHTAEARAAGATRHALNTALARVAVRRDARDPEPERDAGGGRKPPHRYSLQLKRGEIEALDFLRGRYTSAKAFYDGLIPLDDDADQALAREFVRGQGPYRFQIRASDVRRALRATANDGGDYGAIPNLRSDSVDWVLAEEWRGEP
jgi:hypothetical protein